MAYRAEAFLRHPMSHPPVEATADSEQEAVIRSSADAENGQPTAQLQKVDLEAWLDDAHVGTLSDRELRQYLIEQGKASTLFTLLRRSAGGTAGAFVLLPPGEQPGAERYMATTWEAIAMLLEKPGAAALDLPGSGTRISLAGVQDKASVAMFEDGVPRLPQCVSQSAHVLKPDIRRRKRCGTRRPTRR